MNKPAPAEGFFLDGGDGQRFCLFHPPSGPCRGAILYLHPFAEELNRSRRMAALAARALAARGHAVLQIDLAGCGDSSGDFGDARWASWHDDVALGLNWLRARYPVPVRLWGLRLGALLAVEHACTRTTPLAGLLLWQPVTAASQHLTQFLRLRVASGLLANGTGGGTQALRAALKDGQPLEIAGYMLHPALAAALDALAPLASFSPPCPVDWLEAVSRPDAGLPLAANEATLAWRDAGVDLRQQVVTCAPFWINAECGEQPAWLHATCAAIEVHDNAGELH